MLIRSEPFREFDRFTEAMLSERRARQIPVDAYRRGNEFKVLFDLPPIRRGVLVPVASFENGETRSRVIGESEVLALIPAGDEARRAGDLAHVADEHRKNLGEIPRTVHVVRLPRDGRG